MYSFPLSVFVVYVCVSERQCPRSSLYLFKRPSTLASLFSVYLGFHSVLASSENDGVNSCHFSFLTRHRRFHHSLLIRVCHKFVALRLFFSAFLHFTGCLSLFSLLKRRWIQFIFVAIYWMCARAYMCADVSVWGWIVWLSSVTSSKLCMHWFRTHTILI